MLGFILNISEVVLHILFINLIVSSERTRKKSILTSVLSITMLVLIFHVLTFFNIDGTIIHCMILITVLFLYALLRNPKISFIFGLTTSILATSFIYFSSTVAFGISGLFFQMNVAEIVNGNHTFILLLTSFISRLTYIVLVIFSIYFYKNKMKNIEISRKNKFFILISFFVYSLSYELLFAILANHKFGNEYAIDIVFSLGLILLTVSVFGYYILKSNKLSLIIQLQKQKEEQDKKEIAKFTQEIEELKALKEDIIILLTPLVETLNFFEYKEAKQFLEDFLSRLKPISQINLTLNDKIDAAINLKIEECQKKDIIVDSFIELDKNIPSIFSIDELILVITTMFDIAMKDYDTEKPYIKFSYNTKESGVFLEIEYFWKTERSENNNLESILEPILNKTLVDIGGYSIYSHKKNMRSHTVSIPYVGKAYYLKGSSRIK